jgi:hypothetical protein
VTITVIPNDRFSRALGFLLSVLWVAPLSAAATPLDIEIVNSGSILDVGSREHYILLRLKSECVATGSNQLCAADLNVIDLFEFKDAHGVPGLTTAVRVPKPPILLKAGDTVRIPINVDTSHVSVGRLYTGKIYLRAARAKGVTTLPTGTWTGTWTFSVSKPVVTLQVVGSQSGSTAMATPFSTPTRFMLTRAYPWEKVKVDLRIPLMMIPATAQISSELVQVTGATLSERINNSDYVLPESCLDVTFVSNGIKHFLAVQTELPRGVESVVGKVHLGGPAINSLDAGVQINVRDLVLWPLLLAWGGYVIAFAINDWNRRRRLKALNTSEIKQLSRDLKEFLKATPSRAEHSYVQSTDEAIKHTERLNESGELEAAKSTLVLARQNWFNLLGTVDTPLTPGAAPTYTIYIPQPRGSRRVGETTRFVVVPRPFKDVKWKIASRMDPSSDTSVTVRPSYVEAEFSTEGEYFVDLIDGQGNTLASRDLVIFPAESKSASPRGIRWNDRAADIVALAVSAAFAYVYVDAVESFGGVSDYILVFASGFGIQNAMYGFVPLLNKIIGKP